MCSCCVHMQGLTTSTDREPGPSTLPEVGVRKLEVECSVILTAFRSVQASSPHIIYQRRSRPLHSLRHSWHPVQASEHAGAGVRAPRWETRERQCVQPAVMWNVPLALGDSMCLQDHGETPFQDTQGDQPVLAGVSGVVNTNHIPSWEALEGPLLEHTHHP